MKVVSWNVNSLRARLDRTLGWVDEHEPTVLCMQETKCDDPAFPLEAFTFRGYRMARHGQATYNGVAIAGMGGISDVSRGFAGDPIPEESRVVTATTNGVRVVNAYVVNGQVPGSDKFATKIDWLSGLRDHVRAEVEAADAAGVPFVLVGDFNICPEARDIHDPDRWEGGIFCTPEERGRLREIMGLGLTDLLRQHHSEAGIHTWWDYRGGAFARDHGLRIDLALGNGAAASACTDVWVDREARKQGSWDSKPSDHAPVVVELDLD